MTTKSRSWKKRGGALYNSFRGKVYKNQKQLDEAIDTITKYELDDVGNDIDTVANVIAPTLSEKTHIGKIPRESY